ncbi:MAG TPA: hypothetical protein IAA38_04890, partial [Candidatus Ruminococcus gallistercoris]|nr:hypothetical protein [Candidatus Ruminococcus gallistercoris]
AFDAPPAQLRAAPPKAQKRRPPSPAFYPFITIKAILFFHKESVDLFCSLPNAPRADKNSAPPACGGAPVFCESLVEPAAGWAAA